MSAVPVPHRLVELSGELDVSNTDQLRAMLRALLECGDTTDLDVDLAGVTFIDSTALGVLFGAYRRFENAGGRLRVINPPPAIQQVLRVTGLDRTLAAA